MSEDFDVVCRTCRVADMTKPARNFALGADDWNHRWPECWLLVDAAHTLAALAKLFRLRLAESEATRAAKNYHGSFLYDVRHAFLSLAYDKSVPLDWFADHEGHDLGVLSECGWMVDRNGEPIANDPNFVSYMTGRPAP